ERLRRTAAFYAADTWNNELLTLREFESAVKALGLETEEKGRTHSFFQAADENKDGLIRLEDFLQAAGTMASDQQ
ncbi:MAG: EF-hand domain-containing protein, partial [Candidatus Thermoplasmatota archaeon]|nr:EF-hand domain-containing protein [Candidatus Thermoplasmatota archaeon]